MYEDSHFAEHPQFGFFALSDIEMHWCALQTHQIYIQHYSGDYIVVSACAKFNFLIVFILFRLSLHFDYR